MSSFTIKDLENLSGIKAHTLRIWEQRYNFLKPGRSFTNIRYYSNDELKIILNIALLNKYGYKISHIDKMAAAEIQQKITLLTQADAVKERIVTELMQAMIDVDIAAFESILKNYILANGIEETITRIIFSFLEKTGMLWLTNHINPAQEHIVSNIIRQKIIAGIDTGTTSLKKNKTFLLFLPEGEHHELGLLFMHYLLLTKGCEVIYLGSNILFKDVEYIVTLKNPDYIYTHLTCVRKNFNFEKFIKAVATSFPQKKVVVSGLVTNAQEKHVASSIELKHTFKEVMDFVATT